LHDIIVMSHLNLDQFRSAFLTGGLRSVGITAQGSQFFVNAQPQNGDRITLATTRGKQARVFRNLAKAIAVLHEIGARKVEVDTSAWLPGETLGPQRPDTAERQRRAHQAAEYDAWFRAEIEEAIREADDPNCVWVSNEEVERMSEEYRARWRAQPNYK
jgi:hypothetical protein